MRYQKKLLFCLAVGLAKMKETFKPRGETQNTSKYYASKYGLKRIYGISEGKQR